METEIGFGGETPINYEQKCLCVLCLDTSYSMQGAPIDSLNQALQEFADAIRTDGVAKNRIEISIITFDSSVECIQEPALINEMQMPTLQVRGTTKLVDGMRLAINKVEERKQYYRNQGVPYYRPFIVLMTDGQPDRDQDVNGLSNEVAAAINNRKFSLFAVGTGGADMATLNKISSPTPALTLNGLNYPAFFDWLSNSLSEVSRSGSNEQVKFAPVDAWAGGTFSQTPV